MEQGGSPDTNRPEASGLAGRLAAARDSAGKTGHTFRRRLGPVAERLWEGIRRAITRTAAFSGQILLQPPNSGRLTKAQRRTRRAVITLFMLPMHAIVALVAVAAAEYNHIHGNLPEWRKVLTYSPRLNNVTVDSRGRRIDTYGRVNREFAYIETVPDHVKNAFIAAEDQNFHRHGGVDVAATIRAALTNLGYYGSRAGIIGGSTITQQIVKNLVLSPERTLMRKAMEMLIAWRIERHLSKDEILEIYLNHIFLGRNSYGIVAASRAYFGKRVSQLTVAEAALLAAFPKAPSELGPEDAPVRTLQRRNRIIQRMMDLHLISPFTATVALATPIRVAEPNAALRPGFEYVSVEVRRRLLEKFGKKRVAAGGLRVRSTITPRIQRVAATALRNGMIAYDRRHGWRGPLDNIATGEGWRKHWLRRLRRVEDPDGAGDWQLAVVLKVAHRHVEIGVEDTTRGVIGWRQLRWARPQREVKRPQRPFYRTAGRFLRKAADILKVGDVVLVSRIAGKAGRQTRRRSNQTAYRLHQVPEVGGAVVVVDPRSGRILGLSGGLSYWRRQFNAATQANRQPGSTFKPFLYLAAMEAGLHPGTVVNDEPYVIRIPGQKPYQPKNYTGKHLGQITIREALVRSVNVPAVRTAIDINLYRVVDVAQKMGIGDKLPAVPSLALGAIETTPMRLAGAFASLVAGGRRVTPVLIERVEDRAGRLIFRHSVPACPKCGRFAKAAPWSRPFPVEGTTKPVVDPRSIFQVLSMMGDVVRRGTGAIVGTLRKPIAGKTGTTNHNMDAWFVGVTENLVVVVWLGFDGGRSLGPQEQGGRTAAPIAREIFAALLKGVKIAKFKPPPGLVRMRILLPPKEPPPGSENPDMIGKDGISNPIDTAEPPPRYVYEYVKRR